MVSSREIIRLYKKRLLRRSNLQYLLSIVLLVSCGSLDPVSPTPFEQTQDMSDSIFEETPIPNTPTTSPDYVTRLRNAEYQLGLTDALRVVQLEDGRSEQGTPGGDDFASVIMTEFATRGDLDNDGSDEYAVLAAENYGGTGVFVFLAVYIEANGELVFQTSALVDDRPLVNKFSMDNDGIFLDATIHKADELMCCPTLQTIRHYQLINNQLNMTDYATFTPDGRPRTITIESPAQGTEVFRSVQVKGSVNIAPFENNLIYRILDVGGVELSIGSIAVSAPDLGAPGTFEETILLGNILSGAVIRIEVQDVSAEDGSLFAMDSIELVVK